MVPALAAIRRLLPGRIPDLPARGCRHLDSTLIAVSRTCNPNINGGDGGDYHRLQSSRYHFAVTDRKDLGADIDAVYSAKSFVETRSGWQKHSVTLPASFPASAMLSRNPYSSFDFRDTEVSSEV